MSEANFDLGQLDAYVKEQGRLLFSSEDEALTYIQRHTHGAEQIGLIASRYVVGSVFAAYLVVGFVPLLVWKDSPNRSHRVQAKTALVGWGLVVGLLGTKWALGYYNCTFGYLECRAQNKERRRGMINNIMDRVYSLLNTNKQGVVMYLTFVLTYAMIKLCLSC